MKVELNNKETNVVELKVEIPQEQVEQAIEKAYLKVRKDFSMPGFRKGRVPRNIIEKRYGVEVFFEEAANILLQDSYPQAIEEKGIDPVAHPDVDVVQLEQGQPFIYTATVTVTPEVKLGKYKDLGFTRDKTEVTEEDVEKELEGIRSNKGKLVTLDEDAVAQEQDQVVIDFLGRLNGEEFEGGAGSNYPLTLGSNSFVPGFEEQLVGAKIGEKVVVKLTMPEEYHSEELKGKEVEFEVDIKEIKRKELPALDDEFAKEVGDYESLVALKDFIRERLEDRANSQADQELNDKILTAVRDDAEVDIPSVMIDNEVESMVKQMENRFSQQGLKLEDYLNYTGKQLDEIKEEMRPEAEKNVKTELLLDTLAKEENITVESADLDAEIAELAQAYGQEADKLRKVLAQNGQISSIEQVILHRKTMDFLAQANTVQS